MAFCHLLSLHEDTGLYKPCAACLRLELLGHHLKLGLLGWRFRYRLLSPPLHQVLVGFLKGEDGLGQVIEAQAVRSLPVAGFVPIPDFQGHLGEEDLLAVSASCVLED